MTPEQRAVQREKAMREKIKEQRRLADPKDYVWDKAQEKYWDLRDGTLHHEKAVDASIPMELWRVEEKDDGKSRMIQPSVDIRRIEFDQTVEGTTWMPGYESIIKDLFVDQDGIYPAAGRRIYNRYKPVPAVDQGPAAAEPWLAHVQALWPDECEYFFDYCAHMLQKPAEKCNTAAILSGAQGIGKDAALRPVKTAMGPWNVKGIDPNELFSPYRPWLETVMLVVDEVRPTKDEFHASSMYNILKPMIAAPPDTLPLNNKYQALRYVVNVMRVFITTNDWMAMYIPPEDRRMFIMHSKKAQGWREQRYFVDLFGWFASGGEDEVKRWLLARDISTFNPKQQSAKTHGWAAITNTWGEPEDEVDRALVALSTPPVVFGFELAAVLFDGKDDLERMLKSPRRIGFRMQRAGYTAYTNPDGPRWIFNGPRRVQARLVYAKESLTKTEALGLIDAHGKSLTQLPQPTT